MTILQKQVGKTGMFYIEQEGKKVAEMVYTVNSPEIITVQHTEVDPALEGKGVGKLLVQNIVEYARANHISIIPLCPFTKTVIARKKEWQDVLYQPGASTSSNN